VHEWREHTAEVELVIDAARPAEVFAEAALAFAELAGAGADVEDRAVREVRLEAHDRASLLVDWLEELIYLADTDGFVPLHADVQLDGERLEARLEGAVGAVDPLVKAATYHGLAFAERDGRWEARVVLDV
jgi:SHS2 domain-containing protein